MCTTWIMQEQFASEECASLLNKTALYLTTRGRYSMARPLYALALTIRKQLGWQHPETATILSNFGQNCRHDGQHNLSRTVFIEAIAILEGMAEIQDTRKILERILELKHPQKVLERKPKPEDSTLIATLNALAGLCLEEKEYK